MDEMFHNIMARCLLHVHTPCNSLGCGHLSHHASFLTVYFRVDRHAARPHWSVQIYIPQKIFQTLRIFYRAESCWDASVVEARFSNIRFGCGTRHITHAPSNVSENCHYSKFLQLVLMLPVVIAIPHIPLVPLASGGVVF